MPEAVVSRIRLFRASRSVRTRCPRCQQSGAPNSETASLPNYSSPEKLLQLFRSRQRRASAERSTLQCCDGIAKFHAFFHVITSQHSVNESGMECIAGASRVATAAGDFERG